MAVKTLTGGVKIHSGGGFLRRPLHPIRMVAPDAIFEFSDLIISKGPTGYITNYDVAKIRPDRSLLATYYASATGNAANPGTIGSPLTPAAALAKSDVGTIRLLPGTYWRDKGFAAAITKSVNVIADAPGVKVTGWQDPASYTWTLDAGSVYKTTTSWASSAGVVADSNALTTVGDYTLYAKMATRAAMTGPGQWATEGGSVYVWALGGQDLAAGSANILVSVKVAAGLCALGGVTLYVEGVTTEAATGNFGGGGIYASIGGSAIGQADGPTVIAVDCMTKYSVFTGGFIAQGARRMTCLRCTTRSNLTDAFNYHAATTTGAETIVTRFIEIDCHSSWTGTDNDPGENFNGSTAHDGCIGIRVNPDHVKDYGPTLADVLGAKTWTLGGSVGDSRAPARSYGVNCADAGSEMWLQDTVVHDVAQGLRAESGGVIHRRNVTLAPNVATPTLAQTGGSIADY